MIYMPRDYNWLEKTTLEAIDHEFRRERAKALHAYEMRIDEAQRDFLKKHMRLTEDAQREWDNLFKGGAL